MENSSNGSDDDDDAEIDEKIVPRPVVALNHDRTHVADGGAANGAAGGATSGAAGASSSSCTGKAGVARGGNTDGRTSVGPSSSSSFGGAPGAATGGSGPASSSGGANADREGRAAGIAAAPAAASYQGSLDEYLITNEDGQYIGRVKVDRRRKQFNAHCCQLGLPCPKDHRTASTAECRLNRKCDKCPQLAFLVQWLRQSVAYNDRGDHRDSAIIINREDRGNCREWLHQQVELEPLLRIEAEFLGLEWHGVATVVEEPQR
jgi:hypothetical protein